MLTQINSCGLLGIDGFMVRVEADISPGIPSFEIVGLPDAAVKESKERIRVAFKNSQLEFPRKKIIINLAPADIKKEGTSFDLPIFMAIIDKCDILSLPDLSDTAFFGEISLSGEIHERIFWCLFRGKPRGGTKYTG